ncbi:MAG: heme o synthase [Pseudomonadota bacterium]|jgi:protoheme IX farnesyltransferase
MTSDTPIANPQRILPAWRDYLELTKPRVVLLIVFTALVGMFLAVPGVPPLRALLLGSLGIWLAASSAAVVNHVIDQRIDSEMARTRHRPLPEGKMDELRAVLFSLVLGASSMLLLTCWVNALTALLTFASLIGYAIVYTLWLKRATPQNIVIGGAAGAMPPVLGWTTVTNDVHANALLLFLIVFAWTPPHFWALAIARREEYAKIGMPMLPVVYGVALTRLHIVLYTLILTIVTILPVLTGMSGLVYGAIALVLDAIFLWHVWRLYRDGDADLARPMRTFWWSIAYLGYLFGALLVDHYASPLLARL